jgi:hypothetical protein
MNIKLSKTLLFICFALFGINLNSFAQEKLVIPLNEHFYPIEIGGGEHLYHKVVTNSSDGVITEKIYTLTYQIISITKYILDPNNPLIPIWEYEQKINAENQIVYTKVMTKENDLTSLHITTENQIELKIECVRNVNCQGFYSSPFGENTPVHRDIFKPAFKNQDNWNKFLAKNLVYPEAALKIRAQGHVMAGLKISESGELLAIDIMNRNVIHESLVMEVERILKKYKGEYLPALDYKLEPKTEWFYLPIGFVLG